MAGLLNRVGVRFGLYMVAAVLVTVAVFAAGLFWENKSEQKNFYANLPVDVQAELTRLEAGDPNDQRIDEIYRRYWPNDGPGVPVLILSTLVIGLILGSIAAFLSARIFVRPIASLAQTSILISQGNLAVRAHPVERAGEITELINNFNAMAASLERLESERKELIAAISHELRTPLTILQGRLHALCDHVIAATPQEHRRLLDHTEHLVRLVDDLNTLSTIQAGGLSLRMARLNLAEFIGEVMPLYEGRAREHGMAVHVDVSPAEVMADHDRLQQAFVNLVENAIRYASGGKELSIAARVEDRQAVIEVSDRGPGFTDQQRERIFDPFFRLDDSRSRSTGGSGLGLAVVRSLVTQMGGDIAVAEREGGGARFVIRLPLADVVQG